MYHKITDKDRMNIEEVIEQNIVRYVVKVLDETNELIEFIGIAVPGVVTEGTINKCVNLGIKNYKIVECVNDKITKYAIQNKKE